MSTATDGRRREHQVRDHMVAAGWTYIMRAAGSKGPADLILAHPDHGLALVQVGSRSKTLGPVDRYRLVGAADLCAALPILAVVIPRAPIRYWQVDRGKPASWAAWTPEGVA